MGLIAAARRMDLSRAHELEELAWQREYGGNPKQAQDWGDEALLDLDLRVFGYVRAGSPLVHLAHSATRYGHPRAARELRGKTLVFIGDRTARRQPLVVEVTKKAWEWPEVEAIRDAVAVASFGNSDEGQGKLWSPDASATGRTKAKTPWLLHIPPTLVEWLAVEPRTPWELHEEIARRIGNGSTAGGTEEFRTMLDWCLVASQCQPGKSNSCLSFSFTSVLSTEDAFLGWCDRRLESTMGPLGVAVPPQPAMAGQATLATAMAEVGRAVQDLRAQAMAAPPTPAAATKKQAAADGAKRKYGVYELAALKGFSGVTKNVQLKYIWLKLERTKCHMHHRQDIMHDMEAWAKDQGVKLDTGVWLTMGFLKSIVELKFVPGDLPYASYTTCEEGMGPMACIRRTPQQIDTEKRKEEAILATMGTRTYDEHRLLSTTDPRTPAQTYKDFKDNITTYCGLLFVLFGEWCPLYQNLWKVRVTLVSRPVAIAQDQFSAEDFRRMTWAIIEDSREFFSKWCHPDEFATTNVEWPESTIDSIIPSVKHRTRIERGSFPREWRTPERRSQPQLPPHAPGGGAPHPPPGTSPFPGTNGGGGGGGNKVVWRGHTNSHHVHPTLKKYMAEYLDKFNGKVMLGKILKGANLDMQDLPKIPKYTGNDGRSTLCYTGVVGPCKAVGCKFAHPGAAEIPGWWAEEMCRLIAPGVEHVFNNVSLDHDRGQNRGKRKK